MDQDTPDLRQDPEFNQTWRYRVCFYVYPDGSFVVGNPGDGHGKMEAPAEVDLEQLLEDYEVKEFEGQFVFDPEIGIIEQWPVERHELTTPDWLNGEISERVREAVIAHYEKMGPAPLEPERPVLDELEASPVPVAASGAPALDLG